MKKLLIVVAILVAITAAFAIPRMQRRAAIQTAIDSFRVDEAVWDERQLSPRDREKSAAVWLNPPYLKKYGLDMSAYLDSADYFSPSGAHWKQWSLATRAASICMWRDKDRKRSAAEVDELIRKIDSYFSSHSESEAVITVLNAVESL